MTLASQPEGARSPSPGPGSDTAPPGHRPLWWRWVGLATILVAAFTANTVWKINRHVSRMELARIFAQAMTVQRPPRPPPPVIARRPVYHVRRPVPKPNVPQTAPFSLDPSEWIHPGEQSMTKPHAAPPPRRVPLPPRRPRPSQPFPRVGADEPLTPEAQSSRETQISEVTRQTWALVSLAILECAALAGLSGLLDMRRARRNLMVAVFLLIAGTGLAVAAALIVIHWGGYPPLVWRDYAQIVLRGGGPAVALMGILMLPASRRYGRSRRERVTVGGSMPWSVRPVICGLLCAVTAVACATVAGLGSYWSLPAWQLVRWVLMGWSLPAAVLGLLACGGRRGVLVSAYVVVLIGLVLHLACWGLPFAVIGPPAALKALLALLPVYLIVLGRVRACLAATNPSAQQRS